MFLKENKQYEIELSLQDKKTLNALADMCEDMECDDCPYHDTCVNYLNSNYYLYEFLEELLSNSEDEME